MKRTKKIPASGLATQMVQGLESYWCMCIVIIGGGTSSSGVGEDAGLS